MDEFDKIYNEILKEEKNHEAVYKSRLKTKYKAFLEGKNTDMLCKMIQAFSFNQTIASPMVVEKKIEVITELSVQHTDRHILTNDRINEAFDVIKMLERKISDDQNANSTKPYKTTGFT